MPKPKSMSTVLKGIRDFQKEKTISKKLENRRALNSERLESEQLRNVFEKLAKEEILNDSVKQHILANIPEKDKAKKISEYLLTVNKGDINKAKQNLNYRIRKLQALYYREIALLERYSHKLKPTESRKLYNTVGEDLMDVYSYVINIYKLAMSLYPTERKITKLNGKTAKQITAARLKLRKIQEGILNKQR